MKRLFIGVKIHPNKELLKFYSNLRIWFKDDKIKWVPIENFHITLKFLGDAPSSMIPEIVNSLKEVITKFQQFSIEIKGLGCFKKQRKTSVIWLGLNNIEMLSSLANKIDVAMHNLGFGLETRPFKAHLTLGRVKHISSEINVQNYVEDYKNLNLQVACIEEVVLFESIFQKTRQRYEIVDIILL